MPLPPEQDFRAPATAWFAAFGSFLFVTFGLSIVAAGAAMVLPPNAAPFAFFGLLLVIPVLGGLSAWQAFKASRRKAYERLAETMTPGAVQPRSARPAYLVSILGGGLALGLTMFFTAHRGEEFYSGFAGAVAGATFCGLLVRAFVPSRRAVIATPVTCPGCGEQVVSTVAACPVCGASLPERR